ncbi:MAG: HNH endonuclease signature motif containing protein [Ktedonobacterales bacterium]
MEDIRLSESDIERFWKYVDFQGDDACWNWTGWKRGNPNYKNNIYGGFGVMTGKFGARKQVFLRSHRVAYYIEHGYWPLRIILHDCDNPFCVNPMHLREGTHQENTDDMTKKNRHGGRFEVGHVGIRTSRKLTYEMAQQIRSEYVPRKRGGQKKGEQKASDTSMKGLARKYGVSPKLILNVIRGTMWAEP